MIVADNLTASIAESIKRAQKEEVLFEEIFSNPNSPVAENEFLFFIKPEITLQSTSIQLDNILNLIQDKIDSFGLTIHNIKILSAKYLEQYDIIAQHYGVINKISTNALHGMSESAKEKFQELYGISVNDAKVLGGSEFLNQYNEFNAYALDYLCQNIESKKLAGGTYCIKIKIDGEQIYLINGFHPRQLKQFTEKGRSIVVMTLSGNISWSDARSNFIGATNPLVANNGSLRREFLDRKSEFGLTEVSQGVNGVHLSAGPVEALVELRRYNTDFSKPNTIKSYDEFSFGRKLEAVFSDEQFERIINNTNISIDGKNISIFDLTEEKNSNEAIDLIKKYL